MLSQGFGLFEDADVEVAAPALGELGQLDRAREPGGTAAHDEHVQLHPVAGAGGAFLQDESIDGQRRLVLRRNEPPPSLLSLIHAAS